VDSGVRIDFWTFTDSLKNFEKHIQGAETYAFAKTSKPTARTTNIQQTAAPVSGKKSPAEPVYLIKLVAI